MNFQFYMEKLKNTASFKEFERDNPEAFFCSGFFVIDKEGSDNKQHFDFYSKKDKKIFSFQLEQEARSIPVELIDGKVPDKISEGLNFDFVSVEKMIEEKMKSENVKNKIQKFLFSLQNLDGRASLVGTIFVSMMGLLKVHIDIEKREITLFEKKSFMDMLKVTGKAKFGPS